jgi:ATPase family associated with various cellular activities (AAA)
MSTFSSLINDYISAGQAGIWVQSCEIMEALQDIGRIAKRNEDWTITNWDVARGDWNYGKGQGDPLWPLKIGPVEGKKRHLIVLHNFHRFLNVAMVIQQAVNSIQHGKTDGVHFIILAPVSTGIPPELERMMVVLEHDLPNEKERERIARNLRGEVSEMTPSIKEAITTAAGLTSGECELAFALSLARHSQIESPSVWEIKSQMLKKSGSLTLYKGVEGFASLGGMEALKRFCKQSLTGSPGKIQARGVMLLGVPGTGKSAFCKALGNETHRPTAILDVGACYGSLVGQTEERIRQALKIADAMAPCILMIDEVEKALAGLGSSGDSGTASRLFGTLLSWLNDHESDVFVVATSNDISRLPPEFSRAERWDGVFFIDFPDRSERGFIWDLYEKAFLGFSSTDPVFFPGSDPRPKDDDWTGAEIRSCCRLASVLDTSLQDASQYVVPVSATSEEVIMRLREWSSGRAIDASHGGLFRHEKLRSADGTRKVSSSNPMLTKFSGVNESKRL